MLVSIRYIPSSLCCLCCIDMSSVHVTAATKMKTAEMKTEETNSLAHSGDGKRNTMNQISTKKQQKTPFHGRACIHSSSKPGMRNTTTNNTTAHRNRTEQNASHETDLFECCAALWIVCYWLCRGIQTIAKPVRLPEVYRSLVEEGMSQGCHTKEVSVEVQVEEVVSRAVLEKMGLAKTNAKSWNGNEVAIFLDCGDEAMEPQL